MSSISSRLFGLAPYLAGICTLLISYGGGASDVIPMPEEFVTGRAPEGFSGAGTVGRGVSLSELGQDRAREGANALDGNLYTVIAPTFDGSDGNVSYFRFVNLSGGTATVNVSVVGHPSALTYGMATLFIPNLASPQYSFSEILSASGS